MLAAIRSISKHGKPCRTHPQRWRTAAWPAFGVDAGFGGARPEGGSNGSVDRLVGVNFTAARRWALDAIGAGALALGDIKKGFQPTRTLLQRASGAGTAIAM